MSTCNQLDLQNTLGSQPIIMPKNLPEHRTSLPITRVTATYCLSKPINPVRHAFVTLFRDF